MSLSVKFNDIELNEILDVEIGFNPFEGADWERSLNSIPVATGSTLVNSKVGAKTISMPFTMKGDINTKYDNLQRILNVSEPKKLTFGHMPNRYFLAVTTGKTDFKEVRKGFIGHGTITWLIPDGVSHSTDTKIVTASVVDGILTANVKHNGSDDIWPVYRFKSTADNGWYGIVHAGGVLEIGNKEETEGVNYRQSETLLDTTSFDEAGWSNWSGVYRPDARFDLSGSLGVSGSAGRSGLRLSTTGSNTGLFNGGGKVYTLPADSEGEVGAKNFYAWWDTFFWAEKMGQTAVQDIIFWSGNEIIARWYVLKTDKNGNSDVCRASYNDGAKIQSIPNYNFGFKSSHLNAQNPFSASRGSMDFLKEGAKLQFYYSGRYYAVNVPALADKKVTKVSIVLANYDKRAGVNYVTHNAIQKLQIRKLKVDKWRDVPNRFGAGSELVVDTESATINLSGLPANDEAVNPPLFAPLQPGDNKIEFYQSDWSQSTPEITVEWKERYL